MKHLILLGLLAIISFNSFSQKNQLPKDTAKVVDTLAIDSAVAQSKDVWVIILTSEQIDLLQLIFQKTKAPYEDVNALNVYITNQMQIQVKTKQSSLKRLDEAAEKKSKNKTPSSEKKKE